MTIFACVDYTAGAARVEKQPRLTDVLLFGSPRSGTPFMD